MNAPYRSQPPALDGLLEDWNTEKYPITAVVAGASNWTGPADLSATVMWSWDQTFLYMAAQVTDDIYVQNARGSELFKGDSVEILMDTNVPEDYYLRAMTEDDFQLGVSSGSPLPGSGVEAFLWYPLSQAGPRSNVQIVSRAVSGGYQLEAAIPWVTFGVSPSAGRHLGFAFSVSDNDYISVNTQQSMISNVPSRQLTDPTTWGDLALSGTLPPPVIPSATPTQATLTPTATQSSQNPGQRNGPFVNAVYVTYPPFLDGELSDWVLGTYQLSNVVFGSNQWTGNADLSGRFLAGWDNSYLYFGVQVIDDVLSQDQTGANLYQGDSIEVLLDVNVPTDYYDRNLSTDDFQLGISVGRQNPAGNPEAYLWYPQNIAGPRSGVKIATKRNADGYIIETAIPWSVFGVIPTSGMHFGFGLSLSDNDTPGLPGQQSMVSNIPNRALTDPTTWGDLTLTNQ